MFKHWGGSLYHKAATRVMAGSAWEWVSFNEDVRQTSACRSTTTS